MNDVSRSQNNLKINDINHCLKMQIFNLGFIRQSQELKTSEAVICEEIQMV